MKKKLHQFSDFKLGKDTQQRVRGGLDCWCEQAATSLCLGQNFGECYDYWYAECLYYQNVWNICW
jgi:hypothetical protein